MKSLAQLREAIQTFLLGRSGFSAAFDLPLQSPQTEVTVWLHGLGKPRDVTNYHSVACPIPCIFCIAFSEGEDVDEHPISLHFIECGSRQRLLGRIDLEYDSAILSTGTQLRLYRATNCVQTCFPPYRRWIRSLFLARDCWKANRTGGDQIRPLDSRCNEVVFFCPRPIVLVSMRREDRGNIFPMNLMNQVGKDHFVFALNRNRKAGAAVADLAEVAISTGPFEQAETIRALGKNHHKVSIDFDQLIFSTFPSRTLGIPVPDFALCVRELRVEKVLPLGSHDFFIARIVDTEMKSKGAEFYRIHGLYAAWRKWR